MTDEQLVRIASHAGSWYSNKADELSKQLDKWLGGANVSNGAARAIISPHAGYSYSGRTAAYSYKNMDKSSIKRIFILGPSHHVYTKRCMLSSLKEYQTPLGNINLDTNVLIELFSTGEFDWMRKNIDEDEHSIEMQLPYIEKMMQGANYSLVPIMVGSISYESETLYGGILAKYLDDPSNFFVISSDFCHWGERFDYTYYDKKEGEIYQSIQALDKKGMDTIETQDPLEFHNYQKKFKNTICGRHPIGVLLQMLKKSQLKFGLKFVHYEQSSQCKSEDDSSVSYASGVVYPL